MMLNAVLMLRRNIGEPLLGMSDTEVVELGLAACFPASLARLPSMTFEDNRSRMIKYGLVEFNGDEPRLTEKGEALRVQFGLLCAGLRWVNNVGILRSERIDEL